MGIPGRTQKIEVCRRGNKRIGNRQNGRGSGTACLGEYAVMVAPEPGDSGMFQIPVLFPGVWHGAIGFYPSRTYPRQQIAEGKPHQRLELQK